MFLQQSYKEFVDETVINFEDANLEAKYPEYRTLLKENEKPWIYCLENFFDLLEAKKIKKEKSFRDIYISQYKMNQNIVFFFFFY